MMADNGKIMKVYSNETETELKNRVWSKSGEEKMFISYLYR